MWNSSPIPSTYHPLVFPATNLRFDLVALVDHVALRVLDFVLHFDSEFHVLNSTLDFLR